MTDFEREIEESWSANADAWVEAVRGDRIESRRLATNQAVLDAVLQRKPARVLDIGCGEGWLAHRLADRGAEVLGFDSSDTLVSRAAGGPGTFRLLSYASFAADPGQVGSDYDLAVCNFSLLGKEIASVLRGCAEVLTAGGALVIQTVHPFADPVEGSYEDGWRREDFSASTSAFRATMPWYYRTMSSWVREVVDGGFRMDAVREPMHPVTGRPLSLILVALRS